MNPVTKSHLDEMAKRILTGGAVERVLEHRSGASPDDIENRAIEKRLTQQTVVWFFNEAAKHLAQSPPGTSVDIAINFPDRFIDIKEQEFPGTPAQITALAKRIQIADLGSNLVNLFAVVSNEDSSEFSFGPYFNEQNIGIHLYGRGRAWLFMNAPPGHSPWKDMRGGKLVDEAIQIQPGLTAIENTALPDYC